MLSYQHLYHAGNLADVHKHAALSWVLAYLTRKDKPLSYLETHAGRGLYDLSAAEAVKTGEAAAGIGRAEDWFSPDHPYRATLEACRTALGRQSYPGSPWVAAHGLRDSDEMHLAELHPQERAALQFALPAARIHAQDGFEMAFSLCPPTPRRGLMLIDPSYEVKAEYDALPRHIAKLHKVWGVGVIMLWYPILTDARHGPMVAALRAALPAALFDEVRFPPARDGHRMVGSGLVVVNPPWGLEEELARLGRHFAAL